MTEIVLAYAGTGKTYCGKMQPRRFLDLPCMPYQYFLEDSSSEFENEAMKGVFSAEYVNPEYPENYVDALMEHRESGVYDYVLAPSDPWISRWLQIYEVPFILVYPKRELVDEYAWRYINRGNGDRFLNAFIGSWDCFLEEMEYMKPSRRIQLGAGQYLSDVL